MEQRLQLKVGDRIDSYEIIDAKDSAAAIGTTASPLGAGATAQVFKCTQKFGTGTTIERALKLYDPTDDVKQKRKEAELTDGVGGFSREIESVARFNHQNLVKIIDAGTYGDRPYFVMELMQGHTLAELLESDVPAAISWRETARKDPFFVVRLVRQICWPLAYLHERNFFHMDIAPKNLFVREVNDRTHVTVGDVGVAQCIDACAIEEERMCQVAGTRKYTPPVLHQWLNTEKLSAKTLGPLAPYWDVYATAQVAYDVIARLELTDNPELMALEILLDRISNDSTWTDIDKFDKELRRLLPEQVLTAGVEEISSYAAGHLSLSGVLCLRHTMSSEQRNRYVQARQEDAESQRSRASPSAAQDTTGVA